VAWPRYKNRRCPKSQSQSVECSNVETGLFVKTRIADKKSNFCLNKFLFKKILKLKIYYAK
jgi:hypothetical protein